MNLCFAVHHPGRRSDTVRCDNLVRLGEADALNFGLGMFSSRLHLCPRQSGRSARL